MKNTSLYYPLIDKNVRMIRVAFDSTTVNSTVTDAHTAAELAKCYSGKTYIYKTLNKAVSVGDVVVVQAYGGVKLAQVTEVDVPLPINMEDTNFKWVTQIVDMYAFERIRRAEDRLIAYIESVRIDNMRGQLLGALGLSSDDVLSLRNDMAHMITDDDVIDDDEDEDD